MENSKQTVGHIRETLILEEKRKLYNGPLSAQRMDSGDVDFTLDGMGLVAWIRSVVSDDAPWEENIKMLSGRELVKEELLGLIRGMFLGGSQTEEPNISAAYENDVLTEKVGKLEQEVAEADVRAEEAERAQERTEGKYEGMREAFAMVLTHRKVDVSELGQARSVTVQG